MKAKERKGTRVLVALDFTRRSFSALGTAAKLASERRAELVALFIEDADLMRLAELPLVREIDRYSGVAREIDRPRIEQAMKSRIQQARRALSEATRAWPVPASIRVLRGRYMVEALAAAGEEDVLFLARMTWAHLATPDEGRTTRRHEVVKPAPVSVWVLYDGTREGQKALALAAEIAPRETELSVMVPEGGAPDERRIRAKAEKFLRRRAREAHYHVIPHTDCATLLSSIHERRGVVLVLPRGAKALEDRRSHALLEESHCSVVVA